MGEYNKGNRHNNKGRWTPEERKRKAEEKERKLNQQVEQLQIIADTTAYLEYLLKNNVEDKKFIQMKDILDYLNNTRNYTAEQTKRISQYNYMLMDLYNAQRNDKINGNRINIRILYIQERFVTSFKKELHLSIKKIIATYTNLFHWDDTVTGEEYKLDVDTSEYDAIIAKEEAEAAAKAAQEGESATVEIMTGE